MLFLTSVGDLDPDFDYFDHRCANFDNAIRFAELGSEFTRLCKYNSSFAGCCFISIKYVEGATSCSKDKE